jgi:anti-sigma regulatory factor (Ser/Thr protein kinase)
LNPEKFMTDQPKVRFEFSAAANRGGLASCLAAMEESPLYQSLPVRQRFAADLALDELATNTIKYGDCADSPFEFRMEYDGSLLQIQYVDRGRRFDPWKHQEGERQSLDSIEDTHIGGRGLIMMKELSTSRGYERRDDTNVVTLAVSDDPET